MDMWIFYLLISSRITSLICGVLGATLQEELNVPPPRVSDFRDGMETPQTASQPVPARFEPQTRAEPKPKVVAKPKPPPPPPEEYERRIKHAVEAGEVPLKIWTNWTFGAVRDALSKKLKRDDIQKKARFVFKAGTGTAPWIAFKDTKRRFSRYLQIFVDHIDHIDDFCPASSIRC